VSRSTRPLPVAARRPLAAAALIVAGATIGCASTLLENRPWLAVETEHYRVWSALSEQATRQLAGDLERFRSAAEFVWGSRIAPAPVPTRVYAFDDRGVGARLTLGERSYLVPRQRGDWIVLRTGEGWTGDARTPLKLAYARRLFWNASEAPLPPWYEEGLPQLASTLEVVAGGAQVGIPRRDHVETLRRSQWIPFQRLLSASDLSRWSTLELELFESESWALLHYLKLDAQPIAEAPERIHALLARDVGTDPGKRETLDGGLQRTVWHRISASELDSLSIAIAAPKGSTPPALRPVPRGEALAVLGSLALEVGQTERARDYFDDALAEDPGSTAALVGLGRILAAAGDAAGADARFAAARARAPDDPEILLDLARLWLERAAHGADAGERAQWASQARDLYRRCTELAPRIPEGYAGVAESELILGDPSAAQAALAPARRLLPGDASIGVLAVRVALASGHGASARREAIVLDSRARSAPERASAQALLDQVEPRAAQR